MVEMNCKLRGSAVIKCGVVIIRSHSAVYNLCRHVQFCTPSPPPAPCPTASSTVTRKYLRANCSAKSSAIASAKLWLSARIIETEAYYVAEKGSHASLGYTEKRKALFLDGGHIYMYYARGGDSLNFSAQARAMRC